MPLAIDQAFFRSHPSAESFLALFEFLPGVVFYAKDRSSRFIAANAAMLSAKNLSGPEGLLGKTDRDFHPPALAEAYIAEDAAIMKEARPLPNQSWFVIDQNGKPGWFRSSKTPLFSRTNEVIGIAGVRYAISTPEELARQFQNLFQVIRHLENHFSEQVSTDELAAMAGLSVTHFNRRFSELFHTSPNRFLISLRVEKARHLLSRTSETIGEISVKTGFYDQSHFTRHFRKVTGLTPRQYRQQFQNP